jgi:hypothetical protein
MVSVTSTEKAAKARPGLVKHPIATRIGGAVRNAMLNYMHIESGPKRSSKSRLFGPFHYFIHPEIWLLGVLSMK